MLFNDQQGWLNHIKPRAPPIKLICTAVLHSKVRFNLRIGLFSIHEFQMELNWPQHTGHWDLNWSDRKLNLLNYQKKKKNTPHKQGTSLV